jgi:hypothetical protein
MNEWILCDQFKLLRFLACNLWIAQLWIYPPSDTSCGTGLVSLRLVFHICVNGWGNKELKQSRVYSSLYFHICIVHVMNFRKWRAKLRCFRKQSFPEQVPEERSWSEVTVREGMCVVHETIKREVARWCLLKHRKYISVQINVQLKLYACEPQFLPFSWYLFWMLPLPEV